MTHILIVTYDDTISPHKEQAYSSGIECAKAMTLVT